jgi:hypothetical protein
MQWKAIGGYIASEKDASTTEDSGLYSPLPTRVIDVGVPSSTSGREVRLVETANLPSNNARYVALSYRWGASNRLTTNTATKEDRRRSIPLAHMPRTLQDAVIFTSRLGIRYLWIDSVCIIQDDKDDWAREAAKMGDVYTNAYCTIAAHGADHADHGFLNHSLQRADAIAVGGNRNGYIYQEETLAYETLKRGHLNAATEMLSPNHSLHQMNTDITVESAGNRNGRSQFFFVSQGFNSRSHLDGSLLSGRGWVLQERLLSQRTVHFAIGGSIYLESNNVLEHVDAGRELRYQHFASVRSALNLLHQQQMKAPSLHSHDLSIAIGEAPQTLPSQVLDNVWVDWYEIVSRYSTCTLTKPEDKLVALSGIARKLQQVTEDKYYSGIWAHRFHTCLLWLRGKDKLQRSPCIRAPTWSWAAYDGHIQYPVWTSTGNDTNMKAEISVGNVLSLSTPVQDSDTGIFNGPVCLELHDAVIIGTGLRFSDPQSGKPQWKRAYNCVALKSETRFWQVHDDHGRPIGWASQDEEAREDIDGEVDQITCVKIASHADDRVETGFDRGYLVLFVAKAGFGARSWFRKGMGQITEKRWFDGRAKGTIHLF